MLEEDHFTFFFVPLTLRVIVYPAVTVTEDLFSPGLDAAFVGTAMINVISKLHLPMS